MKNTYQFNYAASLNNTRNYKIKSVEASISASNLIELMAKPHFMEGYVHGFKQPRCRIKLRVWPADNKRLEQLKARLKYYFHICDSQLKDMQTSSDLVHCFAGLLCTLQKRTGFPVFESAEIQSLSSSEFIIYIPGMEEKILISLIDTIINIFNNSINCNQSGLEMFEGFLLRIKQYAPKGSNSLRFLQAAQENEIPWTFIEQNIWQFGYGSQSHWFDSSFTDKTSILSSALAHNKISTARLLAKAGLPVPEQILAQHEIEALEAAKKMGYPLVLKPMDSEGGNGVFSELNSENAIKKAWKFLQGYTKTVLIEKQISGKDYRLQILHGQLVWAVERIPASIIGDGKSTIKALIEAKSIEITEAMNLFLTEQGFTMDSILPNNKTIRIHSIANISAGGTPVAVFEKVHPDNRRLAETAANILRLDIAGIDLIMPDIEKSWLETTAVIIEVNAQPQFGNITAPNIYKDILLNLMPGKGRIPIIVLCGNMHPAFIQYIQEICLSHCKKIGIANSSGAWLHGEQIASAESSFRAGKSLLLNNQIDGLIFHVDNLEELTLHGLPFDAFDQIFLLDISLQRSIEALTLLKACKKLLITNRPIPDASIMNQSIKLALALHQKPLEKMHPAVDACCYWQDGKPTIIGLPPDYFKNKPQLEDNNLSTEEKLLLTLAMYYCKRL